MRTTEILQLLKAVAESRLQQAAGGKMWLGYQCFVGDRNYVVAMGIHHNVEIVVEKDGVYTHLVHSPTRDGWYLKVSAGAWDAVQLGNREVDLRLLRYVIDLQADDADDKTVLGSESYQLSYLV